MVLVANVETDGRWVFGTRWHFGLRQRRDGADAPLHVNGLCVVLKSIGVAEGQGGTMTAKTMMRMGMVQRMIGPLVWEIVGGLGGGELSLVGFVSLGWTQTILLNGY